MNFERELTKYERQSIFKEVMEHFDETGVSCLELDGHKDKYTPLYHFRLAEPSDDDFIYVTELFGRPNLTNMDELVRLQYHGNYTGVSRTIIQNVGHLIPRIPDYEASAGFFAYPMSPSFRILDVTNNHRISFDKSLLYLKSNVQFLVPMSIKSESWPEEFDGTYYI